MAHGIERTIGEPEPFDPQSVTEMSQHVRPCSVGWVRRLPNIMADRVQRQQVFLNLMLNAIEAMTNSGGELTVQSQLYQGQVQFSVSDTRVALPTEELERIFSAFFTAEPHGSGVGLAISRSIVESPGGRLWASANDRRGATFHLTLPIQVTEPSAFLA